MNEKNETKMALLYQTKAGPPAAQSYRQYTPKIWPPAGRNEFVICPQHRIAHARKFGCGFCRLKIDVV